MRQILESTSLYFPTRRQLNDPFDVAPLFKLRGDPSDPKFIAEIRAAGLRALHKRGLSAAEIRNIDAQFSLANVLALQDTGGEDVQRRLDNDYRVCSLAGNRDHVMLWSHYASGHNGVCIHFPVRDNSYIGSAQEVKYQDDRPVVPIPIDPMPAPEMAALSFLRKGNFWLYEHEFRLVWYPNSDLRKFGIELADGKAYLPPSYIDGVTIGARVDATNARRILDIARKRRPRCAVWQARLANTFSLTFERIG